MSFGWGGNMYAGGYAPNPDIAKITNLVNVCAQSGSYTFGGNAVQSAIAVYTSLKGKSTSLSIDKGDYAENASKNFEVVYFTGPVDVFYQSMKYSIYIKVLLPPNFPEVGPITSVINIDTNVFTINKEYQNGLLPDETYAIDLFNAGKWSFHKNYDAVLFELTSKLGASFPFFKSSSRTKPSPPRFYPPLVSNFGQNLPPGWGGGGSGFNGGPVPSNGQNQYSNFGQPGSMGFPQQPGFGQNPTQQRPQGPQANPGPSPSTVSFLNDQVNSLALAVKADVQADKKTIAQLANIRSENTLLADQYKTYYVAIAHSRTTSCRRTRRTTKTSRS